jgi:hypothetical protein
MNRHVVALVLSLSMLGNSACMHAPDRAQGYGTAAPSESLEVADVPVHGFKTWIKFDSGERLAGELLSAEPEGAVVVRTKMGDQSRPFAAIRRVTVQTDPHAAKWLVGIGTATGLLVPLSLVTGYYIVFVGPIVVIAGVVAGGIVWLESRVVLKGEELKYLYQYARWPQGWPVVVPIGPVVDPVEPVEIPSPAPIEPILEPL